MVLAVDIQEVLSEEPIWRTSDVSAALFPEASSNEAIKETPSGRGRKVTKEPEAVELSHADWGTVKASGVELKGRTVRVSGAVGGIPPAKETLKGPHCCMGEYETSSKRERTA